MSLCRLPLPIRQKLALHCSCVSDTLVIDINVLLHVAECVILEADEIEFEALTRIKDEFMSTEFELFRKSRTLSHIDAVVVLLGNLGVDVDSDDWQSFKSAVWRDLQQAVHRDQAAQSSQTQQTQDSSASGPSQVHGQNQQEIEKKCGGFHRLQKEIQSRILLFTLGKYFVVQ